MIPEAFAQEIQEEPEPESLGEPSDVPLLFWCVLWVPVFSVILWFMLRIFGGNPIGEIPPPEDEPEEPRAS